MARNVFLRGLVKFDHQIVVLSYVFYQNSAVLCPKAYPFLIFSKNRPSKWTELSHVETRKEIVSPDSVMSETF